VTTPIRTHHTTSRFPQCTVHSLVTFDRTTSELLKSRDPRYVAVRCDNSDGWHLMMPGPRYKQPTGSMKPLAHAGIKRVSGLGGGSFMALCTSAWTVSVEARTPCSA
jgi:hypothetical protein